MSEGGKTQASGGSPSPHARIRSPEAITLRSFLNPITNLDDASLETLRKLLKVTVNLRQRTHHSQTRRIQRGSPGAHELGTSLSQFRSQVDEIAINLDEILQQHDGIPGMYLIRSQFTLFHETMNQNFNDGGNEGGYFDRVQLLEKLMYLTGTLRGHLEVILEQHSYWKAKLAGEAPPRIVRRLDFNQAVDPASQNQVNQHLQQAGVVNLGQPAQLPMRQVQLGGAVTNEGAVMTVGRTSRQRGARPGGPGSPREDLQRRSHRKFTININLCQHMQSGIVDLWESRRHTDVTFIISSNKVTAHRVILASQSEYFDRLLFGEMREAHPGAEIQLDDTPLQTFQLLLQYAYSGCLEVKDAELPDVLEIVRLADRFSFTLLKDALGDKLVGHVSHTNVLQILMYADLYHLPRLQDHCLGFIDKNAAKVLESEALLSLPGDSLKCVVSRDTFFVPEISVFQALVRWKESNGRSSEQMADILQCVRLSEIPPEQLFAVVEPSGLFGGNTILDAIRVQMKPELEQMQPRGKKEEGRNLLKSPTVTVDPLLHTITSAPSMGTFGPPKAIIADTLLNLTPPVPSDVINAPAQGIIRPGGLNRSGFGHGTRNAVSTVTVTLDSLYLINCLKLNAYPDVTTEMQHQQKSFSYTIQISRDNRNWVELFNYRNYTCLATQDLSFPTQAVRSFKFELTGRSDASQQFLVQFASCSFTADQKLFMLRDDGIIAPLSPLTPLATQSMIKTSVDLPTCLMTFNQPYSISMLRFKICGPKSSKGDLTVSVSTERKEKSFKKIGNIKNTQFGTHLTVEFTEQAVSYVMVAIKKTHGRGTPTTPSFTTQANGTTHTVSAPTTLSLAPQLTGIAAPFGESAPTTLRLAPQSTGIAAPLTPAFPFRLAQPMQFIPPASLTTTQTIQPSQLQRGIALTFGTAQTVMTSATKTTPSLHGMSVRGSASQPFGQLSSLTSRSTVFGGGGIITAATVSSPSHHSQFQAPTTSSQPRSHSDPQVHPATSPLDLPCTSPLAAGTTETFTIADLTCQVLFKAIKNK